MPLVDQTGTISPDRVACYNDLNCDVNSGLIQLLQEDITFTGRGAVPDASGVLPSGVPSWFWYVGAGALILFVMGRR